MSGNDDEEEEEEEEYSQEEMEEDEEYREVDPMQVIEDRLMLLEAWLHEDPYQDDVNHKRDEYLSLMEELEILGKKMRKTDKLLALPNQPNIAKLERKRDQYEREVTDIVLYAEQDAFFDLDGENGEAAMIAYMKANSLLGKPLETLAEMPGFEDSKAWNDSFGPLDFKSARDEPASKPSSSTNRSSSATAQGNSSVQLDLSKPHNITILKKKLKKAKQMLEDTTSEKERQKLFKKINEYKSTLAKVRPEKDDDDTSEDHDESNASDESIDPPLRSPVKVFAKAKANQLKDKEKGEYQLLKKKLSKATKLMQNATNSKDHHKFQKKIDEYVTSLSKYPAWKQDQLTYGLSTGQSVKEESQETAWMEQQAVADEERLVEEERHQQETQRLRTHAKSMLEGRKTSQDSNNEENTKRAPETNGSASEDKDDNLDLEKYIEEERKQTKILRKKLKKIDQMIDDKLGTEGDEARYTKEFRKLQKKRKQYLTELGEDHASLANMSIGGSSMNASFSFNPYDTASVDVSASSLHLEDMLEEEVEDERKYRDAREEKSQEQQRKRQERLESAHPQKSSGKVHEDDDDDEQLLRKKLKKVCKMLKGANPGSQEYEKLLKKKRQYLSELGEDE